MKIWNWLNGRKSKITGLSGLVVAYLLAEGHINAEDAKLALGVIAILFGGSVAHGEAKRRKEKK